MEAARATWTDSRLDDLNDGVKGIDGKVTLLDQKMDAGFARLDRRVEKTNERIDNLNHSLARVAMVALASVIALLFAMVIGVIAILLGAH
jgi:tetrahydromethanopterin S-methyltransferase subunit G